MSTENETERFKPFVWFALVISIVTLIYATTTVYNIQLKKSSVNAMDVKDISFIFTPTYFNDLNNIMVELFLFKDVSERQRMKIKKIVHETAATMDSSEIEKLRNVLFQKLRLYVDKPEHVIVYQRYFNKERK